MKTARGLGNVFQPTYRDRRSREIRKCSTWWIVYHIDGRRIRENAHSENRADAVRLLKKRTGDSATGKPVGAELDRITLDDLLTMVEVDYTANSRKSLERVRAAAIHLAHSSAAIVKHETLRAIASQHIRPTGSKMALHPRP